MKPADYTALILGTQCEHVTSSVAPPEFPDAQMVFSFIPSKSMRISTTSKHLYQVKYQVDSSIGLSFVAIWLGPQIDERKIQLKKL